MSRVAPVLSWFRDEAKVAGALQRLRRTRPKDLGEALLHALATFVLAGNLASVTNERNRQMEEAHDAMLRDTAAMARGTMVRPAKRGSPQNYGVSDVA